MTVSRNIIIAICFFAAVLVGYIGTTKDNKTAKVDQAEIVRTAAQKDCVRTSVRSALVVAFKERAAQAAEDRKEKGLATEYHALARGGLLLIPLPSTREDERKHLSEIVRFVDSDGRRAYKLTTRATELITEGCAETYALAVPAK